MKKILLLILLSTAIVIGCENTMNTPTSRVENFLSKYQNMEEDVLKELDTVLENEKHMNQEEKKEYRSLLEKQYQNLSYKIKNEEIINDTAIVDVEIEVLDYATSIANAKEYFNTHKEEFKINEEENETENTKEYIDYKIEEMKKTSSKTKNDITFHLKKEKNVWTLENLSEEDIKKIHGLY